MRQINLVEGKVVAPEGMKVGIVAARFNEIIVNKLLGGAVDGLVRHGVEEENITAAWVPGAFEIPITAQKMAQSGKYDAIICVGAVIRGDTSHYDLVCNESAKGIAQVELATGIPVLFGVITTENIEQAIARAGSKAGNKGYDCALSAIEMVNLICGFILLVFNLQCFYWLVFRFVLSRMFLPIASSLIPYFCLNIKIC